MAEKGKKIRRRGTVGEGEEGGGDGGNARVRDSEQLQLWLCSVVRGWSWGGNDMPSPAPSRGPLAQGPVN